MPEAQAEVLTDQQARLIDDRLATKSDLERLKVEISADAKSVLSETKAEILKWMFGTIGFQTSIILGAVVALSRFGH